VEGVAGAERSFPSRQKEMLRPAVYLASQFDAVIHALIEAPENRVLESPGTLPCERPLVKAAGDRGEDLRDGEIGYEDIVPALNHFVELVASWFRQVELEHGAGVAVERPGQPRTGDGAPLT